MSPQPVYPLRNTNPNGENQPPPPAASHCTTSDGSRARPRPLRRGAAHCDGAPARRGVREALSLVHRKRWDVRELLNQAKLESAAVAEGVSGCLRTARAQASSSRASLTGHTPAPEPLPGSQPTAAASPISRLPPQPPRSRGSCHLACWPRPGLPCSPCLSVPWCWHWRSSSAAGGVRAACALACLYHIDGALTRHRLGCPTRICCRHTHRGPGGRAAGPDPLAAPGVVDAVKARRILANRHNAA